MATFDGYHMDFYVEKSSAEIVSQEILHHIVSDPEYSKILYKNTVDLSIKMKDYAKEVADLDYKSMSNQELWDIYNTHSKYHTELYQYAWQAVQVDILFNNFTDYLKDYLLTICKDKQRVEEAFIAFTTPLRKTILAEEQDELHEIYRKFGSKIKETSLFTEVSNKIKDVFVSHAEKWGHLGYIYAGNADPFTAEYYFTEIKDLVTKGENVEEIRASEDQRISEVSEKQQALYEELDVSDHYKRMFEVTREFSTSKLLRRDSQLFTLLALHHGLLEGIAKNLNIERKHVQFMIIGEVEDSLLENKKVDIDEIEKRLQSCVYYVENGKQQVFTGIKAEELRNQIPKKTEFKGDQIVGQVAQPGLARGVIKKIFRTEDMVKMEEGDILLSIATDPDIVSAMKKAGAIITDQGGITSHAAIVSRELGVPCVIGTKIATSTLNDGDLVEVDANNGVINIIKRFEGIEDEGEYKLHFTVTDFTVLDYDIIFNNTDLYGSVDYTLVYEEGVSRSYLSKQGRQEAFEEGKELLDDNFVQAYINRVERTIQEFKKYKPVKITEKNIRSEWEKTISIFSNLWSLYKYLEEPFIQPLEQEILKNITKEELVKIMSDHAHSEILDETTRKLTGRLIDLGEFKLKLHSSSESFFLDRAVRQFVADKLEISLDLVEGMTKKEFLSAIDGDLRVSIAELKKRNQECVFVKENNEWIVLIDNKCREIIDTVTSKNKDSITGDMAFSGKVTGKVVKHLSWTKTTDLNEGDILVTGMTNPQMIPLLKKSGGIVTDEGGITCHAAIISRELRIPCIVGTQNATQVLQDGDMIELDAEKGLVTIITRHAN